MSIPKLAESGWLEYLVKDCLRPALKAAEDTLSSLGHMRTCDAPDCGRMFDGSDHRSGAFEISGVDHHYCPACEIEAQAKDAQP